MLTLQLFDSIGPYTAEQMLQQMRGVTTGLTIQINSPGGDAFGGENMRAVLSSLPDTRVEIMGVCASAAYTFAMGARHISATENSAIMVHRASSGAYGNATELADRVKLLEGLDEGLVKLLVARTRQEENLVREWLFGKSEAWFTPDEALALGLIDEIAPAVAVAANAGRLTVPAHVATVLQVCKSSPMSAKILQLLGLPADATDEQVEAALNARNQAAIDAAVAENEAKHAAIQAAREASEAQEADHATQVSQAVDAQIAAGKILPASRAKAIAACGNSSVTLSACVKYWNSAPRVAAPVQIVTNTAPNTGDETDLDETDKAAISRAVKNMTALQQRMCRDNGISPEQFVIARAKEIK